MFLDAQSNYPLGCFLLSCAILDASGAESLLIGSGFALSEIFAPQLIDLEECYHFQPYVVVDLYPYFDQLSISGSDNNLSNENEGKYFYTDCTIYLVLSEIEALQNLIKIGPTIWELYDMHGLWSQYDERIIIVVVLDDGELGETALI